MLVMFERVQCMCGRPFTCFMYRQVVPVCSSSSECHRCSRPEKRKDCDVVLICVNVSWLSILCFLFLLILTENEKLMF